MWIAPIIKNLSTPELLDFYYKKYGPDKYTKKCKKGFPLTK